MSRLFALPFALFLALSTCAQKNISKEDKCFVSGIVVKMADGAPLRKVHLSLKSLDDPNRVIGAVTDADGRFALRDIDPGPYRLSVSRVGFVTEEYGQRKPTAPGAVLTLQPGQQLKDLLFRLIPAGVIAGRIFDDDGEPLLSVAVEASRQVYSEGKRSRTTASRVETNDLGEYRLYGLSPGRYFVSSIYPTWSRAGSDDDLSSADAQSEGYAKLYYSGTPDASKAVTITIKPGEEISSIDIVMRKVAVHQIRGHVYNQVTHKPGQGVNLFLLPKTNSTEWDFPNVVDVRNSDGSFVIPEVLPGSYMLISFWADDEVQYVNQQVIDVGNADLDGVAVVVARGVDIAGRITWDGHPSYEKDELTVFPQPVGMPFEVRGQARVASNNLFTLKTLGEGTYRATVKGMSKDSYIKDVRYAEASAMKDGFTITRGEPSTLEIIVSSRGARVHGTVLDADGLPLPGVSVVLVPELSRRESYQLYKMQSTDQHGNFDLLGIAPGDYKLFSWEEVEPDSWQDPEFLKPFEDKGQRITLHDEDRITVKINAISTKTSDSQQP
jgi:protocatechuate 3,4-dioxygenase beta subunit